MPRGKVHAALLIDHTGAGHLRQFHQQLQSVVDRLAELGAKSEPGAPADDSARTPAHLAELLQRVDDELPVLQVADALELDKLGRQFDTLIDSGLFHVFDDEQRPRFVKGLAAVLKPGGTYYLVCFSERESAE